MEPCCKKIKLEEDFDDDDEEDDEEDDENNEEANDPKINRNSQPFLPSVETIELSIKLGLQNENHCQIIQNLIYLNRWISIPGFREENISLCAEGVAKEIAGFGDAHIWLVANAVFESFGRSLPISDEIGVLSILFATRKSMDFIACVCQHIHSYPPTRALRLIYELELPEPYASEVMKVLLEYGANPWCQMSGDQSSFFYVLSHKHPNMYEDFVQVQVRVKCLKSFVVTSLPGLPVYLYSIIISYENSTNQTAQDPVFLQESRALLYYTRKCLDLTRTCLTKLVMSQVKDNGEIW